MRGRLGFVLLVVFGSFFVYCAQNAVGNMSGGNTSGGNGMVGNADGDTCCTPPDPPPYTVLFDQTFTPTVDDGECVSPAIDVAGNRTLVVHGLRPLTGSAVYFPIQWTFGGAAAWSTQIVPTSQQLVSNAVVVLDGRLGKQLRIDYGSADQSAPQCVPRSLTVVGYKQ